MRRNDGRPEIRKKMKRKRWEEKKRKRGDKITKDKRRKCGER